MAKAKLHPVLEELRGQLGDLVFKKYGDRIVVSRKPNFEGVEWSEAQQAARSRFGEAVAYARQAKTHPVYERKAADEGRSAYHVALADRLRPPEVMTIDLSGWTGAAGETVRAQARDEVKVETVWFAVIGQDGAVLDGGAGVEEPGGGWWAYETQTPHPGGQGRVVVAARDLAGNQTERMAEKELAPWILHPDLPSLS